MLTILTIVCGLTLVAGHEVRLYNHCPFTVWVGTQNNPDGSSLPANGGFELPQYQTRSVNVEHGWSGRFWGRTECDANHHCLTGDCLSRLECRGARGALPASLAEFKFDGWQNQDYYDVSHVDGYNLPMTIEPIPGTFKKSPYGTKYDCSRAGCNKDLNPGCPGQLAVKHPGGNWNIACKSACTAFGGDLYCCTGSHGSAETCNRGMMPIDYPAYFKNACPDAYSYAFDDATSTFVCRGNPESGYTVTFCP